MKTLNRILVVLGIISLGLTGIVSANILVKEVPLHSATLYSESANQYNRFLSMEQRAELDRFGPHTDMFGQPMRNGYTIHDILIEKFKYGMLPYDKNGNWI